MKHHPSSSPRALIIGAGVAGLTTARCLQELGFGVTVIADFFHSMTTSVSAGALWEWPPAACGFQETQTEQALLNERRWCVESYTTFEALAQRQGTGVYWRPVVFYLGAPAAANPVELRKLGEMQQHVREFRHDAELAARPGINARSSFVDAYTYEAP